MLVRRIPRLSGEDLQQAVATLLSDAGRVQTFPDGLVVVGDRVAVLQRVHELLDSIERAETGTWVVQLYVVSNSQTASAAAGLDTQPAIDLAAAFSAASAGGVATAEAIIGLQGAIEAVRRVDASSLLAEPLFLLVDGGSSRIERGERIPIARRSVSDQGTVQTVDFDFVQAGLVVEVGLRESGIDAALLDLDFSLSDVSGFVGDEAPIVNRQSYSSRTVVHSGGVYLLGSLDRQASTEGLRRWLVIGDRSEAVATRLQIWARVYRVAPLTR